jgi:hypothetical protein
MELVSSNYNCRNQFIAGLLPELYKPNNDVSRHEKGSSAARQRRNPHHGKKFNRNKVAANLPKEASKVSPPAVELNAQKSKKAIRNQRVREAKRRRRNQKHVHFPEQEDLIAIVIFVEDTPEMKDTRQTYWEFFAVNRLRFKHRVGRCAETLNKVLETEHRNKIYEERFADLCIDELAQQIDRM